MIYTPVTDISAIDLTRHALIEASAGTGKTYTLENLVIRLLSERDDLAIDNILIVTFTEKATSELKIRIQEKLAEVLAGMEAGDISDDSVISSDGAISNGGGETDSPKLSRKLRDTIDSFDMAAIHTIHGFCHTVLQDFAFENQSLFQNELIDDGPVFDALMMEQLRKIWPALHGDNLKAVLALSNFGENRDRFLSQVIAIARRVYRPSVGDLLQPDTRGLDFAALSTAITGQALALKSLFGAPTAFSDGFSQLNINGSAKKSLLKKMAEPIEAYFNRIDEETISLPELIGFMDQLGSVTSQKRKGVQCLLPVQWTGKGDNSEVCPNLAVITQGLLNLVDLITRLRYALATGAIRRLQADAGRTKNENGWISYDDMLSRLDMALHGPHSDILVQRLRARYKIAFVDEFQDTDPVQWRIFKRLFLDADAPAAHNLLFLIGDPKQAIYAFRGADVYAYLEARNTMESLAADEKASLYSLATNWRSVPGMVTGFNSLFGRDEWFPQQATAGAFDIGYQDVASPQLEQLPAFPATDLSDRPEIAIVDLSAGRTPGPAKPVLARFIAREIRRLISDSGLAIQTKDQTRRPLDYGDICLLVRSKAEASFLEEALRALGIPYSFYKKPGLFFSDEALFVSLVCHAVIDPANLPDVKKALLTPFFNCRTDELHHYETLPAGHAIKQLLLYWHELAGQRRWGMLFQSLLEDSGLLFRMSESRDWDRTYTNYRQIFEHLETAAYHKNLDFRGISALLDGYRNQTIGAGEDADIHQIETESRKVQIMTMHVSKGLQFPIVFIAGGLTQATYDEYHIYHRFDPDNPQAGICKEIDLSKTRDPGRHQQEKIDEDKRLYYVALTRAQFKLYVPFLQANGNQGWWGPVSRFVAHALAAAFPQTTDSTAAAWIDPFDQNQIDQAQPAAPTPDQEEAPAAATGNWLPDETDFRNRRTQVESFSSLHARAHLDSERQPAATQYQTAPTAEREDDEARTVIELAEPPGLQPDAELRGGADVGSMFHEIFERIDYKAVMQHPDSILEQAETAAVIASAMEAYAIEDLWKDQVGRIVAQTLTTTINALDTPLILGNLSKDDRLHEAEFYYPLTISGASLPTVPECETLSGRQCFIRGYIDLIFRHGGKYYIADWKSNRIDDGYGRTAMDACMADAGYHLQYQLYTIAVQRWLGQAMGPGYDPDVHFGGVFYFFIRGVGHGGEEEGDSGVYFVPADKAFDPDGTVFKAALEQL